MYKKNKSKKRYEQLMVGREQLKIHLMIGSDPRTKADDKGINVKLISKKTQSESNRWLVEEQPTMRLMVVRNS
jgi:hypothetical protein